jgi:hypothetical protein
LSHSPPTGLWGPDDGRPSRPVLRAAGGETPPADSPGSRAELPWIAVVPELLFWALADKTWPSIVIRKLVRAAVRAPAQRGCPGAVATWRPGIRTIGPISTGIAHGYIAGQPPRSTTDGGSQQAIGRLLHTRSGSGRGPGPPGPQAPAGCAAAGGFSVPAEHFRWFRGSCWQAPPSLIAERGNLRISR